MVQLTIKRILKNRYALATVITTLIILVVAILLASVLTYFAINVVSTRVQQESVSIPYAHLWVTSAGAAQGAIMVTNTGGRDVVINQIQVLGQPCLTANMYYAVALKTDTLTTGLSYEATITAGTTTFGGLTTPCSAAPTTGDFVLPSGQTMVIYIQSPASVGINDVGLTVGFTIFTAQAMYYKETNVQANLGT
jgi:hypothetical protein